MIVEPLQRESPTGVAADGPAGHREILEISPVGGSRDAQVTESVVLRSLERVVGEAGGWVEE